MRLPRVHIIGLGPAGEELVTAGSLQLIASIPRQFLRTERHPSASVMPQAQWFDRLYESGFTMTQVYESIREALVKAAEEEHTLAAQVGSVGEVLYAVPGSPVVAEHTVELLLVDPRVDVVIHPALSFLDLTWARLGVDPVERGVRLIDGHRFAAEAAGQRGPLLVGQCDNPFTLSDIKLSVEYPPTTPVVVLQRLGLPDERIYSVEWSELDREVTPDHLTSLWIPEFAAPLAAGIVQLEELMQTLRSEDPWKAEQTHESLKRYLLEEAYEVFEAIDAYDPDTGAGAVELCSELGDLLYQVVFHSTIAAEAGWFSFSDVAKSIHDKLLARHQVIEQALGTSLASADVAEVVALWESGKQQELGRDSALDQIPVGIPALARALKVAKRASGISGFVAQLGTDSLKSMKISQSELTSAQLGSALLDLVDLAHDQGLDPEEALRQATELRIEYLRSLE
ncbi:MAG: MazG nucleotide pyrophosphohydrolase domain-containing protein [Actinomycetes bacterium]